MSRNAINYIVREEDGAFFLGFNGHEAHEYPDAEKFSSPGAAVRALHKSGWAGHYEIIKDYGLDSEEVVRTEKLVDLDAMMGDR